MMHSGKLVEALADAERQLGGENTVDKALQGTLRALEQARVYADGKFDDVISSFELAFNEVLEGIDQLHRLSTQVILDPTELEAAEERLFALRAMARKHQVSVEDLSTLKSEFEQRLGYVEDSTQRLTELEREEQRPESFVEAAENSTSSNMAGAKLDQAVNEELAALK